MVNPDTLCCAVDVVLPHQCCNCRSIFFFGGGRLGWLSSNVLKGMKVTQRVNLAHTSGGIHKSNGPEKYRLLICHLLRRQKKGKVNCLLHKKCNNPKLINPSFPLPTTYVCYNSTTFRQFSLRSWIIFMHFLFKKFTIVPFCISLAMAFYFSAPLMQIAQLTQRKAYSMHKWFQV